MLTSDFRTALRSLSRRRGYSALHLTGLGVGLACCLLIGLFVRDELRYDRFHADGDRIVRLMASGTFDNGFDFSLGGLPSGAAMDLMASRPEVEVTTQMSRPNRGRSITTASEPKKAASSMSTSIFSTCSTSI